MKKALAYAATAVLLGFAIMMLPKTQEPRSTTETSQTGDMRNYLAPSPSEYGSKATTHGPLSYPENFLPSSLIVFIGLVAALSLHVTLKKRAMLRA